MSDSHWVDGIAAGVMMSLAESRGVWLQELSGGDPRVLEWICQNFVLETGPLEHSVEGDEIRFTQEARLIPRVDYGLVD